MNPILQVFRLISLAALATALSACSLSGFGPGLANSLYCDNFLIYDMCAEDLNRDGVVEYVYFADTMDVFMYRDGAQDNIPDRYGLHRCAQLMDEQLVATTSRVFSVDEHTSYLEKQDIRGAMMIKYIAYMPRVTACSMRGEQALADGDSGA